MRNPIEVLRSIRLPERQIQPKGEDPIQRESRQSTTLRFIKGGVGALLFTYGIGFAVLVDVATAEMLKAGTENALVAGWIGNFEAMVMLVGSAPFLASAIRNRSLNEAL